MIPTVHSYSSQKEWISAAADEITAHLPEHFSLALSGGSTPAPVYEELSKRNIDWKKGDIFVVDERFVPRDHTDSNQKLIREHLPVPANFHFWNTEKSNHWKESAQEYNAIVQKAGAIDVGILGIGPDGHTASLFPHSSAAKEKKLLATFSETDQFAVTKRVTMTFPEILRMKKLIILLQGSSKREVLDELFTGKKSSEEYPAKRLLKHNNMHIFFADI